MMVYSVLDWVGFIFFWVLVIGAIWLIRWGGPGVGGDSDEDDSC